MPAANQTPPTFRIRSTGLSQEFEGAGERISSIVKSPSAASATACVLWTVNDPLGSGPQISVAKTLCLPFVPIALPPASSRPRPSTWIRPVIPKNNANSRHKCATTRRHRRFYRAASGHPPFVKNCTLSREPEVKQRLNFCSAAFGTTLIGSRTCPASVQSTRI
jgi:hypothetical protein